MSLVNELHVISIHYPFIVFTHCKNIQVYMNELLRFKTICDVVKIKLFVLMFSILILF